MGRKTQQVSEQVLELLDTAVTSMGGQNRPGQHEMARQVAEAIESGEHLLVQAGTGTGKSLAYLVPLIAHALDSDKPALVSTATLALQSQIVGRDLPRLLKTLAPKLPREVDVALLKGRSNYVCVHKTGGGFPEEDEAGTLFMHEQAVSHPAPAGGPTSALGRDVVRLQEWAQETETGDRDELLPGVSDRAWRQVSVTSMECLGAQKCPVAELCFSEQARAKAAVADLVITNHAMLAIAAFEGLAVLPDYDVVVIDEAHELQDRVTGAVTGQLSGTVISAAVSAARKHTSAALEPLAAAGRAFDQVFAPVPSGLLAAGLSEDQEMVLGHVRDSARTALSDSKPDGENVDGGRQMARSRLMAVQEMCDRILDAGNSGEVVWASRPSTFSPGAGYTAPEEDSPPTINVAPLSVAGRLREGLFDGHTVVLTSATLAIGAEFGPVAGALGLLGSGAPKWNGTDVGSPFDYPRQGVLYVAKDLPKPGRGTSPEQLDEIEALIKASGGGALGLFSSRRAAEEAADALRTRVDFPILCQGESTMSALVQQFADDDATCLFGTMSLWQGVDVPGASCRLVIMDRIPFPRPDDPLMTARTRAVAKAGGNGFMSVSATHAAVRLAQGAGRLIRASGDKGVVAVLDSRLATARYGSFLRAALPPFWSTTDRGVVLQALERLSAQPAGTRT
ncbi:ATP-dependent DNA helicase [Arthrobacter sp. zg-Y1143]|uniref:ATP-dependent DNA helicase n=1 Tax=Arthrobacter sp. zg-Y1143 TaxID=3049065 RepID=UPI0024C236F5|nr:ATP-dependent DNA helicase [Arthrobacter sp. zg-Y1143]MDK1328852.1 ATP-dependent DNA helicase [Arthrobacter sp. zg-Y1143]